MRNEVANAASSDRVAASREMTDGVGSGLVNPCLRSEYGGIQERYPFATNKSLRGGIPNANFGGFCACVAVAVFLLNYLLLP